MKKTLGIELKGNRAIYVMLEGTTEEFSLLESGYIELVNSKSQKDVQSFHEKWMQLIDDHDFNRIAIKERISKGRFAGGPLSFKMEGLIQLSDYEVEIVHGSRLRTKLKSHDPAFGKLHSYKEEAARIAYYLLL